MRGFEPLNDISKQLNVTFSSQIVIFMLGVLLMGIFTCLGLYKYSKVTYDYLKWYLYMAVSSHVLIFVQATLNSSSYHHVSFIQQNLAFPEVSHFRLTKYSRRWEKYPAELLHPKQGWSALSVQSSKKQAVGFSKWIWQCLLWWQSKNLIGSWNINSLIVSHSRSFQQSVCTLWLYSSLKT